MSMSICPHRCFVCPIESHDCEGDVLGRVFFVFGSALRTHNLLVPLGDCNMNRKIGGGRAILRVRWEVAQFLATCHRFVSKQSITLNETVYRIY